MAQMKVRGRGSGLRTGDFRGKQSWPLGAGGGLGRGRGWLGSTSGELLQVGLEHKGKLEDEDPLQVRRQIERGDSTGGSSRGKRG